MKLTFTKQEGGWTAEFTASDRFNIHIEGVQEGNVRIYQKGTEVGEYAYIRTATPYPSFSNVYDKSFAALVYPKWIKVVCDVEPSKAVVTRQTSGILA